MKRKLFSKKDGTTTKEDIAAIKQNIKARFEHLPIELKKLLPIAEDIVIYLQLLDDMLEEGHPVNEAIEKVLALTKTEVDDELYELFKVFMVDFAHIAESIFDELSEWVTSFQKRETAVDILSAYTLSSELQADTAIQLAVYSIKS